MADTAATEGPGSDDDVPDTGPSLLEDLLGLIPRLADRTSAQIQFSQSLLSMLPCARTLFPAADGQGDLRVPEHEAPQPTDVLTVLATDDVAEEGGTSAGDQGQEQPDSVDEVIGTAAPAADDLAIPEYDSLAASQVVPRLTTLSATELEAVSAYESSNRNRRTILNRVTALLAD